MQLPKEVLSSDQKIKAAVIGDPIAHSLSPIIHGYFLEKYAINGTYQAIQLGKDELLEGLAALVNDGFCGFNITIPHKESVIPFCTRLSEAAKLIGAVNTITVAKGFDGLCQSSLKPEEKSALVYSEGTHERGTADHSATFKLYRNPKDFGICQSSLKPEEKSALVYSEGTHERGTADHSATFKLYRNPKDFGIEIYGDNSDEFGFIQNLKNEQPNFSAKNANAFVIGAGGASRAVVYSLIKEGANNIFITNRSNERAIRLIADLEGFARPHKTKLVFLSFSEFCRNLSICDLLINSTSLGMQGQEPLKLDLSCLNRQAIIYDLVYKPLETKLLLEGKLRGNPVVNGLGMLIEQAKIGFSSWFKIYPESDSELTRRLLTKL